MFFLGGGNERAKCISKGQNSTNLPKMAMADCCHFCSNGSGGGGGGGGGGGAEPLIGGMPPTPSSATSAYLYISLLCI